MNSIEMCFEIERDEANATQVPQGRNRDARHAAYNITCEYLRLRRRPNQQRLEKLIKGTRDVSEWANNQNPNSPDVKFLKDMINRVSQLQS